jgi:uncharacterized protein
MLQFQLGINLCLVCIDSNIFVSAIGFGGKPLKVIELALKKEFLLVSSEHIFAEVRRNLVSKISLNPKDVDHFLGMVAEVSSFFSPSGAFKIAKTREDNLVIETALMGFAEVLVSGDRELVDMAHVGDMKIERTSVFLQRFRTG